MMRFDRKHKISKCTGHMIKGYMGSFKESKGMVCFSLQEN